MDTVHDLPARHDETGRVAQLVQSVSMLAEALGRQRRGAAAALPGGHAHPPRRQGALIGAADVAVTEARTAVSATRRAVAQQAVPAPQPAPSIARPAAQASAPRTR